MELRQSLKVIKFGYTLCLAAEVAIAILWIVVQPQTPVPVCVPMLIPVVLALFIAIRHIRRRMTRITITADQLRYESGLFSKTMHAVELAKVQDVRVDQTFGQRLIKVGDLSIETAGGSSRIEIDSIDNPRDAADHILKLAQAAGTGRTKPDTAS
jgi:membrane protein YdbS with pleckstrin-like domain